jgi:hypothetical protein
MTPRRRKAWTPEEDERRRAHKRCQPSGINRIYRLYREEGLAVRKRRARHRAVPPLLCNVDLRSLVLTANRRIWKCGFRTCPGMTETAGATGGKGSLLAASSPVSFIRSLAVENGYLVAAVFVAHDVMTDRLHNASKPTNVPFKRRPVMVMGLRYLIESL